MVSSREDRFMVRENGWLNYEPGWMSHTGDVDQVVKKSYMLNNKNTWKSYYIRFLDNFSFNSIYDIPKSILWYISVKISQIVATLKRAIIINVLPKASTNICERLLECTFLYNFPFWIPKSAPLGLPWLTLWRNWHSRTFL